MAREGAASSCQTSNLVFAILALTPRPGLGCPSAPPRSRLRCSRPDGQRITRQLFRDCPSDYRLSEGNRSQKRRPVGPRSPAGGPRSRLPEPSACRPGGAVGPRPRDHGGASSPHAGFFPWFLRNSTPELSHCDGLFHVGHPAVACRAGHTPRCVSLSRGGSPIAGGSYPEEKPLCRSDSGIY